MKMKAAVFVEPGRIVLEEKPIPDIGPLDALVRITTTTICGTDIHILKGEYPVRAGLIVGHEPVGVIEKLGSAVHGFREGQRVIAGAITPSGYSNACLCGWRVAGRRGNPHGWKADRRLEVRQHDRRLSGRVRAGARRDGESGPGTRRAQRRAGAHVPGHHVDRLQRGRERRHLHRRHGGGIRARTDWPVRNGGREALRGDDDHRRRHGAGAHRNGPQTRRRSLHRFPATRTRSRRSCD